MATHIGRITRFAGATGKYWWSVLHHSFLVEQLVCDATENSELYVRDSVRLHALLHDLHEAYTSDLPTPFKTHSLRREQERIDAQIYESLCVTPPNLRIRGIIRAADRRAMLAEACYFNDPYWMLEDDPEIQAALNTVTGREEGHVEKLLAQYGSHPLSTSVWSRGVQDYVTAVTLGIQHVMRHPVQPSFIAENPLPPPPAFIPNPEPLFSTEEEARAAGPDAWFSWGAA